MDLLLDTQTSLWIQTEPARIGEDCRALLADTGNRPLFSVVSVWEIGIKWSIGRLALPDEPATYIPSRLDGEPFEVLNVSLDHVLRVASLPLHHRDPFDRLLVAQALVEGASVITSDPVFARYGVSVISP